MFNKQTKRPFNFSIYSISNLLTFCALLNLLIFPGSSLYYWFANLIFRTQSCI